MILVRYLLPQKVFIAKRRGRKCGNHLRFAFTPDNSRKANPPPSLNGSLKSDCIPGRELLICLIIVLTGAANRGGAEAGAVDSQSHGGLHPGRRPGQLGSSDEAGGADGARRKTEERSRGHCESWLGQDRLGVLGRTAEGGRKWQDGEQRPFWRG